jgi:SAM-dependent methyltransferase
MSGSFPVFDAVVRRLIGRVAPARALDVGAGEGKYGGFLAEEAPQCERLGIERDAAHVARFGLESRYHRLVVGDVCAWWPRPPAEVFDLVILGNCLEHLPKSAGLDLLNALVYRCAWLVLVVGEFRTQPVVDHVAPQPQVSVWSERDLHWHDLWAWDNCRATSLLLLRGYQPATLTLDQLVEQLNAADLPLHHFDGQSEVRALRLRQVEQRREVDYRLP